MTGSGARGNEPRYCIKGRDFNKYLQLLGSEGLCFTELIDNNKFEKYSGHNPQKGCTIISCNEFVS